MKNTQLSSLSLRFFKLTSPNFSISKRTFKNSLSQADLLKKKKIKTLNKLNWTYLGDNNKKHHVVLMHGAQSGHLLVYCNTTILLIDFEILESKTYSFFIEDELCEINIEYISEENYSYGFNINKDADTPRNRNRKKIAKKHALQSFGFLVCCTLFVLVSIFIGTSLERSNQALPFATNLMYEAKAEVLVESDQEKQLISYVFTVGNQAFIDKKDHQESAKIIDKNGMPLESGDELMIKYHPNNPNYNKIDFSKPVPQQLAIYRERAINKYLSSHPNSDPKYCTCMANVAYELKGTNGLADIYFMNTSAEVNPIHNENSFKRLTNSIDFLNLIEQECSK